MTPRAELPDPEKVLALAWTIAESGADADDSTATYGTHAEQVAALVALAAEIRAVMDWRRGQK